MHSPPLHAPCRHLMNALSCYDLFPPLIKLRKFIRASATMVGFILQDADDIFIQGLRNWKVKDAGGNETTLYHQVWQAGVILLPVQSVGVMGDERTYERAVALRAVTSTDAMTADWAHLPYEFLGKVSNDIINKVKGVNRVTYDISSKPPSTIEWE